MPQTKPGFWKRLLRLFRPPTFEERLSEASERLRGEPIRMRCPKCGESVPLAEKCAACGHPRHPTIDRRA